LKWRKDSSLGEIEWRQNLPDFSITCRYMENGYKNIHVWKRCQQTNSLYTLDTKWADPFLVYICMEIFSSWIFTDSKRNHVCCLPEAYGQQFFFIFLMQTGHLSHRQLGFSNSFLHKPWV
jgi:hypothetical protein